MVIESGSRKPLSGVSVIIAPASKKSDKVRREFVTDAMGNFKITQMPPGEVVIVLEKKGYKTSRKANIVIKGRRSAQTEFRYHHQ